MPPLKFTSCMVGIGVDRTFEVTAVQNRLIGCPTMQAKFAMIQAFASHY